MAKIQIPLECNNCVSFIQQDRARFSNNGFITNGLHLVSPVNVNSPFCNRPKTQTNPLFIPSEMLKSPARLIWWSGHLLSWRPQSDVDDYLLCIGITTHLSWSWWQKSRLPSTASSALCWDRVTLLKMNGDLLKYSSSEWGEQVLVRGLSRRLPGSLTERRGVAE